MKTPVYSYVENGVKIDVYTPRKPRPEELTWSPKRMKGSMFASGRKAQTVRAMGYRSSGL
jgi:hypothetical protein